MTATIQNVHSHDSFYFCPIDECPRGKGGEGFKSKNQMIRHSLVHNVPGYTCPFCPVSKKKYSHAIHLRQHVRDHHPDKGEDDPTLLQSLSQRQKGRLQGGCTLEPEVESSIPNWTDLGPFELYQFRDYDAL
ncbi:hypothetical protein BDV26DRAFT_155374 [Aspergillus bertholletiae]|uniref:C2H2-type domain-containing protein n=1 Tax=Aspergillus bertholletiae TaxID=1226010 RepID=A0A5N7BDG9_9EURO|nr:hypothetical protein BDV26DRAFT_155374 [Aspergillus bertholletiae]